MLSEYPIWVLVLASGLVSQLLKLTLYSVMKRHLDLALIAQGSGLPSLQANLLGCLLIMVTARSGWQSGETAFVLVFAVIVVHDTMKLTMVASRQREAVYHLVAALPEAGEFHQRVAGFLDPRLHQVSHVAVGFFFGGLFALAFGIGRG